MTPEFRVWHPKKKEFKVLELGSYNYGSFVGVIDNDSECVGSTWELYTGLKDKDGNKIYKGDVVKMDRHGYNQSDTYTVKDFIQGKCVFQKVEVTDGSTMFQEATNGHDLTVIGNVHTEGDLIDS